MSSTVTYQKAGVDIDKAEHLVTSIKKMARSTSVPGVIGGIGGFSALFDIKKYNLKHPLMVTSTDGVGTKLEVAELTGRHDTIGIDLVAMCVNDLITCGARPVVFLDYYATGKLNLEQSRSVIKGIADGCKQAGCALVGGETAEMPGFYNNDQYDLAGFSVGLVDKSKVIDGRSVREGDAVIGFASSGFHSNGFSLIRKVYSKSELAGPIGKKILEPTIIYVKPVLALLQKVKVKSLAHITGGGFYDNIPRVVPDYLGVHVDGSRVPTPQIFWDVMERANLGLHDMFRTFNMGIGMVAVVSKKDAATTIQTMKRFSIKAYEIGRIAKGSGVKIL